MSKATCPSCVREVDRDTLLAQLAFRTGHSPLVPELSYASISEFDAWGRQLAVSPGLRIEAHLFRSRWGAADSKALGEIMGQASPTVLDVSGVAVALPTFLAVLPFLLRAFAMHTALAPGRYEQSRLVLGDIPGSIEDPFGDGAFAQILQGNAPYLPHTIDLRGTAHPARWASAILGVFTKSPRVKRVLATSFDGRGLRADEVVQFIFGMLNNFARSEEAATKFVFLTRDDVETRLQKLVPDQRLYKKLCESAHFETMLQTHRAYYAAASDAVSGVEDGLGRLAMSED